MARLHVQIGDKVRRGQLLAELETRELVARRDQAQAALAAPTFVTLAAHFVWSRALRPLRDLKEGVGRLSAGDLDVALENRTRDEFGALTDAFNSMAARGTECAPCCATRSTTP